MEEALVQAAGKPERDAADASHAKLEGAVAALCGEVLLHPPSQGGSTFQGRVTEKCLHDPIGEIFVARIPAHQFGGARAQAIAIDPRDERLAVELEFLLGRLPVP